MDPLECFENVNFDARAIKKNFHTPPNCTPADYLRNMCTRTNFLKNSRVNNFATFLWNKKIEDSLTICGLFSRSAVWICADTCGFLKQYTVCNPQKRGGVKNGFWHKETVIVAAAVTVHFLKLWKSLHLSTFMMTRQLTNIKYCDKCCFFPLLQYWEVLCEKQDLSIFYPFFQVCRNKLLQHQYC